MAEKWTGPAKIAWCPEHGLHGARDTCFECGKPVEQLEMVPLEGAEVFVLERGAYEDAFIDGVFWTLEDAMAEVEKDYPGEAGPEVWETNTQPGEQPDMWWWSGERLGHDMQSAAHITRYTVQGRSKSE
jgi:hypothetical protein